MKFLHLSLLFSAISSPLFAMQQAPKPKNLTPQLIAVLNNKKQTNNEIFATQYTADGNNLVTAGLGDCPGLLTVWNVNSFTQPNKNLPAPGPVSFVTINPNNKELATNNWNKIDIWDMLTSKNIITLNATNADVSVQSVDYNKDGSLVVASDSSGICKIWDLRSKTCTATLESGIRTLWSAKWNPSNSQIATTSSDMNVRVFDTRSNRLANSTPLQITLGECAFDSTGKKLVVGAENQIIVCDPISGNIIAKYTLQGKKYLAITF